MKITTQIVKTTEQIDIPDNKIKPLIDALKKLTKTKRKTTFPLTNDLSIITTFGIEGMDVYATDVKLVGTNKKLFKLLKLLNFPNGFYAEDITEPNYHKQCKANIKELKTQLNKLRTQANKIAKTYKIDPSVFWYDNLANLIK